MSDRAPLVGQDGRPPHQEFNVCRRARLIVSFFEADEVQHSADDGWAWLEGPWVHFYGDEFEHWQSWPIGHVICIDWRADEGQGAGTRPGGRPMTLLSEARSLLLQARDAGKGNLSEAQRSRMKEVAWLLSPCTCGRGPNASGHTVACLNGEYGPGYAVVEPKR